VAIVNFMRDLFPSDYAPQPPFLNEALLSKKIKFMLLLCGILSLGFITTSMVGYFIARDSLSKQISTDTLPLIGDNIYSEIQRDLLKPIIISSLMANDTFLRAWVIGGEKTPVDIQNYLQEIQSSYRTVTSFFISDRSLKYYHSTGVLKTIDENSAADQWYFQAKNMRASHELNIDYDPSDPSSLTVFINYKVFDQQGGFLGITGVGLALENVQKILEDYQSRYRGEIFFVDANAKITLRGAPLSKGIDFAKLVDGQSIKQRILDHEIAAFSYREGLHKIMLNSRFLEEFHWYLVVRKSDHNLDDNLFDSLLINLLISLIITIMVLSISWFTLSGYQRRLEAMATTDKLTGLNNRQMFDPILERLLKRAARSNNDLAAVIIDIDYFKKVNDQHGHPFGDKVLVEVANLIKKTTRKSDVLCRWGGEEFVVLMLNCNSVEAMNFAAKLQAVFAATPFSIEEHSIEIQLSIGISSRTTKDKPDKLIFRADQALLSAKNTGRNRIVIG